MLENFSEGRADHRPHTFRVYRGELQGFERVVDAAGYADVKTKGTARKMSTLFGNHDLQISVLVYPYTEAIIIMENLLLFKIKKMQKEYGYVSTGMFTEFEKMVACRNIITDQKSTDETINDFQRDLSIDRKEYKPEDVITLQKLQDNR